MKFCLLWLIFFLENNAHSKCFSYLKKVIQTPRTQTERFRHLKQACSERSLNSDNRVALKQMTKFMLGTNAILTLGSYVAVQDSLSEKELFIERALFEVMVGLISDTLFIPVLANPLRRISHNWLVSFLPGQVYSLTVAKVGDELFGDDWWKERYLHQLRWEVVSVVKKLPISYVLYQLSCRLQDHPALAASLIFSLRLMDKSLSTPLYYYWREESFGF